MWQPRLPERPLQRSAQLPVSATPVHVLVAGDAPLTVCYAPVPITVGLILQLVGAGPAEVDAQAGHGDRKGTCSGRGTCTAQWGSPQQVTATPKPAPVWRTCVIASLGCGGVVPQAPLPSAWLPTCSSRAEFGRRRIPPCSGSAHRQRRRRRRRQEAPAQVIRACGSSRHTGQGSPGRTVLGLAVLSSRYKSLPRSTPAQAPTGHQNRVVCIHRPDVPCPAVVHVHKLQGIPALLLQAPRRQRWHLST